MRLSTLLSSLPPELATGAGDLESDPVIRGIAYDSRRVSAGDLFFALRGADVDGHDYLEVAFERGAVAAVVEAPPAGFAGGEPPLVVVADSRRALAPISMRFFGEPSSELSLIGITGTNGKTSTSYLLESILRQAGTRVGLIGTVDVRYAGERERAINTTPESYDLQRTLRSMRTHGVEAVVMEVSSHGLALGRVAGCRFAVAALTNVTQDHLDFHLTMADYRDAKILLFERHLTRDGAAVINVDDPEADGFLEAATRSGARIVRVSRQAGAAEVKLLDAVVRLDGTRARIGLPTGPIDVDIPLVGDFNIENGLVACGIAVALGLEPEVIADGVARCPQVPGRVERVNPAGEDEPTVLVDYAHTPDAVDKLLSTLRPLAPGRLISVFGCGGDRDRAKRPLMAEAVARWSDRIIATSDNPRTEDPEAILADVETGLAKLQRTDAASLDRAENAYAIFVDRREAINAAIAIASPEDIVAIAGKGHEDYQIIGRERLPFDDRDEARIALAARRAQ